MRAPAPAAVALAAALCASCDSVPEAAVTTCKQGLVLPGAVKTDILFVVDDSGSMAAAQTNLAASFQAFIDRLASSPVKNDFQIGVTTTSVDRWVTGITGSYDTFVATSACPTLPYPPGPLTPYPAGALVSVTPLVPGVIQPDQRVQSTTTPPRILAASSPTLVQDFTANVNVGVCGSGKEQGLEAARRALSDPLASGGNAGFLRQGSRLAVIVVSDDDDCSDPEHSATSLEMPGCTTYDVQHYIDFVRGLAREVVVGAIVAVDPTTLQPARCAEPGGTAEYGGFRYKAFADAFAPRSVVDSVCRSDFHDALVRIAGLIDPGQTVPLQGEPADWRLLSVRVVHASGSATTCTVAAEGTAEAPSADAVYLPPQGGSPASLQFQNACRLQQGDTVDVNVLCAG